MSDCDKSLSIILITIVLLSVFPLAGYLGILLLLSHMVRRNTFADLFNTVKKDPWLMFLLSALGLSFFFSNNHMASLMGMAIFTSQLLFYIMIRSKVKTKENNLTLIRYLLITSLFVTAFGVFQYYFINHMPTDWIDKDLYKNISNRAFSTLYNPNVLGSYLIIIISITLAGFNPSRNISNKLVPLVILVLSYLCMILTFSRGAWLGLAASILVIFIFSKEKPYIITVLGATLLLTLPEFDAVLSRVNIGFLSNDSSNEYRWYLWKVAFKTFTENPLFGTGIGSFGFALPSHAQAAGYLVSHAHNIYLHLLAEIGLVGFIAFFSYIGIAVYVAYRMMKSSHCKQTRKLSIGVMAACIGLMVHGTVDATLYLPQLSVFIWLIIAVARNMGELEAIRLPAIMRLRFNLKPVLDRLFFNIK